MSKAPISEIFSSIQGEGPYSGEKQIFVRFQECDFNCGFCDERKSQFETLGIPEVLDEIDMLESEKGPHPWISWTGGEPLLHPHFLKDIMPEASRRGFKNYLETNGIHFTSLVIILGITDVIAMDIKLPSMTGQRAFWEEHEEFLNLASRKEVFAKMVLSEKANVDEFDRGVEVIEKVWPETPLVLQPLSTREHPEGSPDTMVFLESLRDRALHRIPNVQIIKRLHKKLNIR